MHAFLLTGSTATNRREQALSRAAEFLDTKLDHLTHHPDAWLLPPDTSIGITQVRLLRQFTHRQPFHSPGKVGLILEAHTLSLPAQHALLKILEEPPGNTIIILTTPNPQLLLPTIVSRCQVITLKKDSKASTSGVTLDGSPEVENKVILQLLSDLPSLSPAERLARVGEYATSRDAAISFCESLLAACRHHLRHHHNFSPPTLRHIFMALNRLNANINPRLTLEHLLINL